MCQGKISTQVNILQLGLISNIVDFTLKKNNNNEFVVVSAKKLSLLNSFAILFPCKMIHHQ